MFDRQRYLRDLLGFVERRIVDTDGRSVTVTRLEEVFHQPFDRLLDVDGAGTAAAPVPQVRVSIEVLRHLLGDDHPDEAPYRAAALDTLLATWGLSRVELDATEGALHGDDGEAAEMVASVASRLGVAQERIAELLEVAREPTEEALDELFGLPSTRREPGPGPDGGPTLLEWQLALLPEADDEQPSDGSGRPDRSARHQTERTLEVTLQAAVAAAEADALPILRDLLVEAAAPPATDDGPEADPELDRADRAANLLTQQLAIDLANSGQIITTRLHQAAETVQAVVFGLRTGLFGREDVPSPAGTGHPAAGWRIGFDAGYSRGDFDTDWHWMGRYEMWRSAARTLVHPDAALLPSLVDDGGPNPPTRAFRQLVASLRTTPQLSPRQARQLAAGEYLTNLREELGEQLPDDIRQGDGHLTDDLSDAHLEERRSAVREHFERAGLGGGDGDDDGEPGEARSWLEDAPNWLTEVYYLVPMALALELQRSGHYLGALAWYRSIYAYDLEPERRKVFHGLVYEEGLPVLVLRDPTSWLRDGLNPHTIASRRGYAYTRFTLQSIISCFCDFADAEYAAGTATARARARGLYLTALDLLDLPEVLPPGDARAIGNPQTGAGQAPESSAIRALRRHAQLGLDKQRTGRNIAGLEQPGGSSGDAGAPTEPVHRTVVARPTIYRYRVLIERATQLVGYAQQIEASYLSATEKADAEAYNLLQARQDLALSDEQVELQDLRADEADLHLDLARQQRERAELQRDGYQDMIDAGLSRYERSLIESHRRSGAAQKAAADARAVAQTTGAVGSWMSTVASLGAGAVTGSPVAAVVGALGAYTSAASSAVGAAVEGRHQKDSIDATVSGQIARVEVDFDRRRQEWRRQQGLARKDVVIGSKQVERAVQQRRIFGHEREIAQLRADHAAVTLDFLANKFTNAELYEWMSGVLNRVYRSFLQQATAMALLAQDQLAFERQERVAGFIRPDYWRPPADGAPADGRGDNADRRGLTGSARLLQDIVKLDQFAFTTRERKLELSQTFSLSALFPFEFEQFRQTGQLPFATSMELFDRAFPGHHLRLIKRVSLSVLALVPPATGVRASLSSSGISRVVVGPDVFRTVEVHRSPEHIAFTSPMGATGLFDLQPGGELLLPFEGQGVDTTWVLEMPRAANPFDFGSLADVLLTVDYTAQHSTTYRRQVVSRLDRRVRAERPFHFRHELAGQWYDLHNPDPGSDLVTIGFDTRAPDFPPNLDELRIEHLLLSVVRSDGSDFELPVHSLRFAGADGAMVEAGATETVDGIVSTRRINGRGWAEALADGPSPIGWWELSLPNTDDVRQRFDGNEVDDVLFVVSFSGRAPAWPP